MSKPGSTNEGASPEPTRKAQKQCAEWLAYCISIGWDKSELDGLEALWWVHHDRFGALVPSGSVASKPPDPPAPVAWRLWDETLVDERGCWVYYEQKPTFPGSELAEPLYAGAAPVALTDEQIDEAFRTGCQVDNTTDSRVWYVDGATLNKSDVRDFVRAIYAGAPPSGAEPLRSVRVILETPIEAFADIAPSYVGALYAKMKRLASAPSGSASQSLNTVGDPVSVESPEPPMVALARARAEGSEQP